MAHIFFEKLENRRSTQTLFTGYTGYSTQSPTYQAYYGVSYTPPYSGGQLLYGAPVAVYAAQIPDSSWNSTPFYNPFPNKGIFPWGGISNPFTSYNPYSMWSNPYSMWSNPFTSPWTNPFSNLFGSFISPFRNIFGGFFGWQPSLMPIYPGYPNYPGYSPPGEIRALYGISTSYIPPSSSIGLYYGIDYSDYFWQ